MADPLTTVTQALTVASSLDTPLRVVVGSALLISTLVVIPLWKVYTSSKSGKKTEELSREEQLSKDLRENQQNLTARESDIFKRVISELDRTQARNADLEKERDRLEKDRDRGWNLARAWCALANRLLHALLNARTAAQNLAAARKEGPIQNIDWGEKFDPLPNLEDLLK